MQCKYHGPAKPIPTTYKKPVPLMDRIEVAVYIIAAVVIALDILFWRAG